MSEEVTLAQLATEIAQLRRQMEDLNRRLDMIYGAVTRLADQTAPAKTTRPQPAAGSRAGPELSAAAMMSPGTMLEALHQYAVKAGLDVPQETVERLKEETPTKSAADEE